VRVIRQMVESSKIILVVEDDREVREIALTVLESSGYRVIEAANGDAAYNLLLADPGLEVDVLFTDVVMPGRLDGVDLAVLACALRPKLHVLFASGFASLVRADRAHDIDGALLRKPYRPADLRRALAALFADAD
jgi:CheY-like chemotaxis protein